MAETLFSLIRLLADGQFHSGEALGKELGLSRAAVWKSLQQLPELGLELYAVPGRGYCLDGPIELFDSQQIHSLLVPDVERKIGQSGLTIFNSIESTNDYLKNLAATGDPVSSICLAEHQSTGRGRRGRYWHSPYGSNVYLSLLWPFNEGMSQLEGLSLAVAVALIRCFKKFGADALGIKWPNDIVASEGKVAGILIDAAGEASGPCYAVIGIGVNYAMTQHGGECVDQAWTTLRNSGVTAGRNEVVAELLNELFVTIGLFEREGFEPFRSEWECSDTLLQKDVIVHTAQQNRAGLALGIDKSGLLMVEHDGEIVHYAAGEVTLRKSLK